MDLSSATYVVVDTETTGLRAEWDRVIELAAVRVAGGQIVDTFSTLINPGRAVPGRITRITGISTAMVFDQPPVEDVLPDFLDFLGEDIFVAHNLPFDHRFITSEMERCGLSPLDNPGLCTVRLARRLLPSLPSRGLGALGAHFGISNRARHRALGDAEVTAGVLMRLLDRLTNGFGLTTVEDVLAFQHRRYRDTSGEQKHVAAIRNDVLPTLPDRPGVYTFKRKNGEVLYVGKAKSLANRVRSYFSAIDSHPARLRRLVRDLRVIEWEETGSELGALLLESHRIKVLRPRDNRAQVSYRDYPFLRLEVDHRYPRLSTTHGIAADGAEYYGPINRRATADELVELVDQHFGLRLCEDPALNTATSQQRACLYHDLQQCVAPCVCEDDRAYGQEVDRVRRLLRGDATELMEVLEVRMANAADRLDFEAAGRIRDQIRRLSGITSMQRPFGRPLHEINGVLVEDDARGGAQIFVLREGRIVDRLDGVAEARCDRLAAACRRWFNQGHAAGAPYLRSEIDELKIISHWLRCEGADHRLVQWDDGMNHAAFLDRLHDSGLIGGTRGQVGVMAYASEELQRAVL